MNDCSNQGFCDYNNNNQTVCICDDGFLGDSCSSIDHCFETKCKNNSTCQNTLAGSICECSDEYTGDLCDIENICMTEMNPCGDHGDCISDSTGKHFCQCAEQYQGTNCTQKITCDIFSCKEHQTCLDNNDGKSSLVSVHFSSIPI